MSRWRNIGFLGVWEYMGPDVLLGGCFSEMWSGSLSKGGK